MVFECRLVNSRLAVQICRPDVKAVFKFSKLETIQIYRCLKEEKVKET